MKGSVTAAVAAVLFNLAASRVAPLDHIQHELRDEHFRSHWTKKSRIEGAVSVPVRVGLTQSNLDKGEALLMDISHPKSENYGKHLSATEVDELFAPSQDKIDAVTAWLKSALSDRVITLSRGRQWLELNATIIELQDLLHTEYHEYENRLTGRAALGCEEYHVPMKIRDHIDFITPGVMVLEIKKRADNTVHSFGSMLPEVTPISDFLPQYQNNPLNCSFVITPECVRALYNVSDKPKGHPNNSVGIYSTQGERYSPEGLNTFFKYFAPEIPQGTTPTFAGIDGAPTPSPLPYDAAEEADLDFQAVYPLAYPNEVVNYLVDDMFYQGGGDGVSGLFNTFLDALDKSYCTYSAYGQTGDLPGVDPVYPDPHEGGYDQPEMCGAYTPTNVISISYDQDSLSLPMNYQRRQCNEWMKLGLQGVTVVFSSGDGGVAGFGFGCDGGSFGTVSPADCPYVTAVGATNVTAGRNAHDIGVEHAAMFSGGGFSNIFGTPSYQADAVHSYFNHHPPPYDFYNITLNATHKGGVYNRGGRGYPDVSAVGTNFIIWMENNTTLVAGTSVSAPLFAGLITRINAYRLNAGKKPVGFVNPVLYQHPEAFNDITVGNNPGCDTDGFSAVKGWDPVTGLGTPNYSKLKDIFLRLK
ncbi:subtilisin [Trichoderma arundinaceum]|uniref:tripeptidyl-peptidase II n=1 Tax=Trichoderma arundinaceum TaxID=490622 RepID=A0A395NB60_TRIAR|nr:subtilisin [Trichoderma arundinaceum]